MALTISALKKDIAGNKRMHSGQITFDSSYDAGGESLTPNNIGLHNIENIEIMSASGFYFEYDYTNRKVKVLVPSVVIGAAGAATIDDFPLTGTGASTARSIGLDNAASGTVRFGAQQEVAASTNLSAVVARFIATGY